MKKIHFFEIDPLPESWQQVVAAVNDTNGSQTTWEICEKLNGDNQKIVSENKNEIPEMVEQDIEEFEEFVHQLESSSMTLKY